MGLLTLGNDGGLHEFDAFSLINGVLFSVEGYLWMDSGIPLMQIWVSDLLLDRRGAGCSAICPLPTWFPRSGRRVRRGGVRRCGGDLNVEGWTLVIVLEVEDDLIEVLQGERLEDLLLTLRIVGYVSALSHHYVTNFFMDSISSFFYSLDVFIQNYSYNIPRHHLPPFGHKSVEVDGGNDTDEGIVVIQKDTQINKLETICLLAGCA